MKPFVTVTLKLHDIADPIEIADYVADGRFVPLGTEALSAINACKAIHYKKDAEVIIPYHAIEEVNITKESKAYEKPADAFCTEE